MVIILFYFIANILLSMYIERIRRSTAVVAHAVLFAFTFVCLFFCSGVPVFKEFMLSVFEEYNYNHLMDKLYLSNIPIVLPFVVVEVVVLLQMLLRRYFLPCKPCRNFCAVVLKNTKSFSRTNKTSALALPRLL